MVILVVFNSFNAVKDLKKPDLAARQKPPFYTTDSDSDINSRNNFSLRDSYVVM